MESQKELESRRMELVMALEEWLNPPDGRHKSEIEDEIKEIDEKLKKFD